MLNQERSVRRAVRATAPPSATPVALPRPLPRGSPGTTDQPLLGVFGFVRESRPGSLLAIPLIYSLIVPIALLDRWVSVYQAVCFRLYGIARVRRSGFLILDRHRLPYLNGIERLNCAFCSYANGTIGYAREIAARTEQYWCPIKHARPPVSPHDRYTSFVSYGDPPGYLRLLPEMRRALRPRGARQDPEQYHGFQPR